MKPIIYQLLVRTFSNLHTTRVPNGTKEENGCGTFEGINEQALAAIKSLNVTHVWYTGVIRHATATLNTPCVVKGKAGSPYAITDYYDVDPDLAVNEKKRMAEFENLIKRTHENGLKVIIDFVPNHVAREYHSVCKPKGVKDLGENDDVTCAFSPSNDFYYLPDEAFTPSFLCEGYEERPAKATGNDCFTAHPSVHDWYDTVKLNYGVDYCGGGAKHFDPIPPLWTKMLDILLFWANKGIDGLRCDMVGMVPIEFWQWAIKQVKKKYPELLFIGELYEPHRYQAYIEAGFDYLYDKVGMYDYLRGVVSKGFSAAGITAQWMNIEGSIRDHLLYFFENHDEQRIASGFFCGSGESAEPAMIVLATLERNPLMIYAGQELGLRGMEAEGFSGVDGRSSIFDYWSINPLKAWANEGKWDGKKLSEAQKKLQKFYKKLLSIVHKNTCINEGLMYDLQYAQNNNYNPHRQFSFLRRYKKEALLVVVNFDDKAVKVDINIPQDAFDYLKITPKSSVEMKDLLRGEKVVCPFNQTSPITVDLAAWTGVILQCKI